MNKVKTGCILRHSLLSGRVYAITRWSVSKDGKSIMAITKHDVTGDFQALRKQRVRVRA